MDDETELPYPLDEIDIEAELSMLEAIGADEGDQEDVLEDGGSLSTSFPALPSSSTPFYPSQRELDACPNNRLKDALQVWYLRLRELSEFKERHGHCNVPQKYEPHQPLGIWVNKQRSKRSSLCQDKVQALDSIGFDWGTRRGDQVWKNKFNELVEYKRRHGDCLVPTKYKENLSLGRWVSAQRKKYRNLQANLGKALTPEKVQQLEEIGFVWCATTDLKPE